MTIRFLMIAGAALLGVAAGLSVVLTEDAKLLADAGNAGDEFGAAVSISGQRAVVAAYGDDALAVDGGAVYVYERHSSGVWLEEATLRPDTFNPSMQFGRGAVSLHRNHLAVGARLADPGFAGRVFVFRRRPSGEWLQVAALGPGAPDEQLGESVALHGNRLVAGAPFGGGPGRALVYERKPGGPWLNTAELTAPPGQEGTSFGSEVAIRGRRIVVGAPSFGTFGPSSGAAFVYEVQSDGTWESVRTLVANDTSAGDGFGFSVAMSGSLVVVSSPFDDDFGNASGAVYVFERLASGWAQVAKLRPDVPSAGDEFGYSTAISGERIAVGARRNDISAPGSGIAYVFDRQVDGTWRQTSELRASDGSVDDAFGFAVTVALDTVVIGVPNDDDAGASSGAAYVFDVGR